MSVPEPDHAPESSPPQTAARRVRRSWRWPVGIALGLLCVTGLAVVLVIDAVFGGTTVTVRNVGDGPVEGIVLLAVSEGSEVVRGEWPIGTLRPGEAREVQRLFAADTNLAVRRRAADGAVSDDRLPIYVGSPLTHHVQVDLATSGVIRARHRSWGGAEFVVEREGVRRGLEPGR